MQLRRLFWFDFYVFLFFSYIEVLPAVFSYQSFSFQSLSILFRLLLKYRAKKTKAYDVLPTQMLFYGQLTPIFE